MPTKTRVENPIPDEILAAKVIAGIDNATVAQYLALNGATLDSYPKIMDAARSFVVAIRGWNVSADGDPMDVDAMTKGKGKGKKVKGKGHDEGYCSKNESKDATDNQSDRECSNCKTKGHMARHCKKRINDEKAKAGQHRDNSQCNNTNVKQPWQHWKRALLKVKLRTHRQFPCHHFSSRQHNLQQRVRRWQDKLQQQRHYQRCNVKPYCKTSGQTPTVIFGVRDCGNR